MRDPRRALPSVDRLLADQAFAPLLAGASRELVLRLVRGVQDELRTRLAGGGPADGSGGSGYDAGWYAARVAERLTALERPSLRPVINATGVVLHTNLGRAPLAAAARAGVERVGRSFSNLEYDLDLGERGSRYDHCAALLSELTGAEAALVVNNNAAALVLALNTLAAGRAAVVSRGELVEIGGAFRIPEIMEKSGARLLEVGATNKTRSSDYATALGGGAAEVGAVLKVHRSNFRIVGFTAEVPLAELVSLAHERSVPVINDLGSGLLQDLTDLGLPHEPTAGEALRAGADLVTMSGDKLLGGPQAGIILGRADLVARLRANPLCRAFRVDKLTLAALEATLALYRDQGRARREIPVLRMLSLTEAEVAARAAALAARLHAIGVAAELLPGVSLVGGGAYPGVELPTRLLALSVPGLSGALLERALRAGESAVAARVVGDRVVFDLRTVLEEEETMVVNCVLPALEVAPRGGRELTTGVSRSHGDEGSSPGGSPRAAAFIDRDGTLIVERHYLADPAGVELIGGAAEALRALRRAGYALIVVTNQSGIARGLISPEEYEAVHRRLEGLLAGEGVRLDGTYHCPHHPDHTGSCDCRKPGLGLYRQAAAEHELKLAGSVYIGDRVSDVLPALALGGAGYLVGTGYGSEEAARVPAGIRVVPDLAGAVAEVLDRRSAPASHGGG